MVDLDKVKAFCMVVRYGSLTRASQTLNRTISGVKKQVNSLEQELGHKLFHTIHQRLVLTEKGEIFYGYALKLLGTYMDAHEVLETGKYTAKGRFVVSTTNAIASTWLVGDLVVFLKQNPDIFISLIGDDDELDLSVREADIAIRPQMEKSSDHLVQKYLKRFEYKLYASEEYIREKGLPKTVEDLAKHSLIGFADYHAPPYRHINWHLDYVPGRKTFNLAINSGAGLIQALEKGLGIGPTSCEGAKMSQTNLIPVMPELSGPPVDLYYIYPHVLEDSKKVHLLYDFLVDRFQNQSSE